MNFLRDTPSRTAQPSPWNKRQPAQQRQVVRLASCRSRCRDRRRCARARCPLPRPRRRARRAHRRRPAARRHSADRPASSRACPAHASGRPARRPPPPCPPSPDRRRSAETSLTRSAPAASAAARHGRLAACRSRSRRRRPPPGAPRSPARCGRSRRPRPPRRRRAGCFRRRCRGCSAPAARIARAWASAAPARRKRPPSEKLSGVTLRMPMIRGRSIASPQSGARGAVSRARAPAGSSAAAISCARPAALDHLDPVEPAPAAGQRQRRLGPRRVEHRDRSEICHCRLSAPACARPLPCPALSSWFKYPRRRLCSHRHTPAGTVRTGLGPAPRLGKPQPGTRSTGTRLPAGTETSP